MLKLLLKNFPLLLLKNDRQMLLKHIPQPLLKNVRQKRLKNFQKVFVNQETIFNPKIGTTSIKNSEKFYETQIGKLQH